MPTSFNATGAPIATARSSSLCTAFLTPNALSFFRVLALLRSRQKDRPLSAQKADRMRNELHALAVC
jgi:hypothetical protein